MANSYIEYTSGLTGTTFSVPFKYISIDDVQALGFDGEKYVPLTISSRSGSDKTITLSAAPSALYTKLRLYRSTSTAQLVDFQNGSRLSERDLDTAYQQGLFTAQEISEDASTAQFAAVREVTIAAGTSLSNFASEAFTGDGTSTVFDITVFNTQTIVNEAYRVSIDGVMQSPIDAYSISMHPSQITFTSAPPSGSKIVVVTAASAASAAHVDDVTIGLTSANQVIVKDGGITSTKLATDAVTEDKIENGAVTEDKIENGAVTTAKIATGAVTPAKLSTGGPSWETDGETTFSYDGSTTSGIYNTPSGVKTIYVGNFDSNAQLWVKSGTSGYGQLVFGDLNDDDVASIVYHHSDNSLRFRTNGTESMRIDSSGRVLVGLPTPPTVVPDSLCCAGRIVTQDTYNQTSGSSANVYINSSGFLFRSTSSKRYKENVNDYEKGIEAVKSLRPVTYESINSDDTHTYAGFLAEEVHEAGLSEFVEYNDEGQPDALHYSHMTAVLTKALQEALTKIETLEARVEALENA